MKELLITSSVLIAVILLLRRLFRKRVSQRLIYAAWLLVALRLLIPIQFGKSQFSIATLVKKTEANAPIQQVQQALREPVAGPSRAELYDQLLNEYLQENPVSEIPDTPEVSEPPVAPQKPVTITPEVEQSIQAQVQERITGPTVMDILTAIWFVGICGMGAWFLTANLLFMTRARRNALPFEDKHHRIRISPNVPTPCVVGLFRPVIYLTAECAENDELRSHVLTHEKAHLRHGDHIWALVRCLCLCIYWFNPLVWIAAAQSRRDCELACDESALRELGDSQRIAYGKTLLDIVSHSMSPVHLLETATAMNETKKQLTERVNFIVKKPRNLIIAAISLLLIAAIATGCAFAGSKLPTAVNPTQSEEPSVTPLVNGSVTKPGYKRVFLITEVSNYYSNGNLDIQHTFTYDEMGQLLTKEYKNPSAPSVNQKSTYSRNEKGLVSTIAIESYKVGSSCEYGYDQFSLINYHNYTFDDAGRLTGYEIIDEDDTTRHTFAYDNLGRLILRTKERPRLDAENNTFIYDSHGHLSKIVTPRVTIQDLHDHDFTYDDQGRLAKLVNGFGSTYNFGTTTYEYDDQGRLVREAFPTSQDLTYTWENGVLTAIDCANTGHFDADLRYYELDGFGNVTRITHENGKWTEFKYMAVDLPDEYADRALLHHRVVGPRDFLAAYCGDIMEHFMPYGNPTILIWDDLR